VADNEAVHGDLLDERLELSLHEVCHICGASREVIVAMVREGVIEPLASPEGEWTFSGRSVTRIQTALRLQRDLEVNLPGVALAVELLEEIERLKRRLGD